MDRIKQVSDALGSPDEEVRLQGLRNLSASESLNNLDLIFRAFGDVSWRVRKESIDIFLSLPVSRELIGEIVELLHAEENAGLRNAAVEILTRMGRDAVPMLLSQATCPDHDVRKFVIDILGDIAAPEALETLVRGLADEDGNVRAAAAENLGKLKLTEAVPPLLEAMQHQDLLLQFTILDALSRIAAPVSLSALQPYKDERLLRKALVDCLGKAGDHSAVSELVKALTDSMRNVREAAVMALVDIAIRFPQEVKQQLAACEKGPVCVAVCHCLENEFNDALKRAAIKVLGWLAVTETVEPLLRLLEYETLQQDAIAALIDIGGLNPVALVSAWGRVEPRQQAYLAYVMGESRCSAGLPLLMESLQGDDAQLVSMSAHALGKIGSASILPQLVNCLHSPAPEVQEAASGSLVELGRQLPDETFAVMQPLLHNHDPRQRMFAVMVLRELDNAAVLKSLGMALKDPEAEVRRAAIKVFERYDVSEHIGTLLLSLTDEDAEVRRTAIEILGQCSDPDALAGLQLAMRDEDIWVRSLAVRGLGRNDNQQSRALVKAALTDPIGMVSIAAMETLVNLEGADACPQLVAALQHPDEEVVTAALNLLTHFGAGEWLTDNLESLINHPYWVVRAQIARSAVAVLGAGARPLLEQRLSVEVEDVVRLQLVDLLAELPPR